MMNSGALLPSHGLPPFGANITNIAMGEGLCGSSMFGGDRWGVNPMTAGNIHFVIICFDMYYIYIIMLNSVMLCRFRDNICMYMYTIYLYLFVMFG